MMTRKYLLAVLAALALIAVFAADASAMYDAPVGRWLQRDPIGYADGMSLYQSFRDNPACVVDPTGQILIAPNDPLEPWKYSTTASYYPSRAELDALEAHRFTLYVLSGSYMQLAGAPSVRKDAGDCVCGPDVTTALKNLLNETRLIFAGLDKDKQDSLCGALYRIPSGKGAWDIRLLYDTTWIPREYPGTAVGKGCEGTVEVEGFCHRAQAVNYVMWGVVNKLCRNSLWRTEFGAFVNKAYHGRFFIGYELDWVEAGYNGWPLHSETPFPRESLYKCCLSGRIFKGLLDFIWVGTKGVVMPDRPGW